jgi:hypothetical protein
MAARLNEQTLHARKSDASRREGQRAHPRGKNKVIIPSDSVCDGALVGGQVRFEERGGAAKFL